MSAYVPDFKRINRFIRLNLVHERSQIRKRSPKVNVYVLIIAELFVLVVIFLQVYIQAEITMQESFNLIYFSNTTKT